jgi:hypothetical protein
LKLTEVEGARLLILDDRIPLVDLGGRSLSFRLEERGSHLRRDLARGLFIWELGRIDDKDVRALGAANLEGLGLFLASLVLFAALVANDLHDFSTLSANLGGWEHSAVLNEAKA